MPFMEAVESLAQRFNVPLEQVEGASEGRGPNKVLLKTALEQACNLYHFFLLHTVEGQQALGYLYSRGIDLEFIRYFQLGLAPKNPGLLYEMLHSKSIKEPILVEAGLISESSSGSYREFFSDRIMFPIRDPQGSVIAFSGRKYKEETYGGKCVNTPETPLFKKSRVLFGLNYCRKRIVKERKATFTCHSILVRHMTKCGNRSIRQEEFDSLIWNEVIKLMKDPSLLEQEIARRVDDGKQNGCEHLKQEKIKKELKQLLISKDKLLDAYQAGNCLTIDELRPRMEKIKKRIGELEIDLNSITTWEKDFEKNIDFKATLEYLEKRLITSSEDLSITDKQKVVRLLIEEVVIGKDSIKIRHCIPSAQKTGQDSLLSCVCYNIAQVEVASASETQRPGLHEIMLGVL
jgi:hypothetical protein